jgi:hypothetical protein
MLTEKLIDIDGIVVRSGVLTTHFACDLEACKGACCTFESEYGAPVTPEEIAKIEKLLDIVLDYLPAEHKDEIIANGFYEIKEDELLLKSLDNKACLFVHYESGIAKCAIEKAYFDGKVDFRKPISCHLFPVRIARFGGDILRFERFLQCSPALEKGDKERIALVDFAKEALIRKYGETWWNKLKELVED